MALAQNNKHVKRNTLTDGTGITRPDDPKMVKMPLPEDRGEATPPPPIKLPDPLTGKIREKLTAFKDAEKEFNTFLKGVVEGFMSAQEATPPGWNTYVDPDNGIIFFLAAQEQPPAE